jgi:hypothetical protein
MLINSIHHRVLFSALELLATLAIALRRFTWRVVNVLPLAGSSEMFGRETSDMDGARVSNLTNKGRVLQSMAL